MTVRGIEQIINAFATTIHDASQAVSDKIAYFKDAQIGIKIAKYYAMASIAKKQHNDTKLYNYIRRICIQEYQKMRHESDKEFLLKYVDKKFLKVK